MGIIDNLTALLSRGREAHKGAPLGTALKENTGATGSTEVGDDDIGNPPYAEDIVAMVEEELSRRREERRPLELQWRLNANFLAGHQYCDINPHRGEVEDVPPPRDYMERGIYNRIAPLIETRIANLRSVSCPMTVNPRTNEIDDYEKSRIATQLLRYTQSSTDFEAKKNQILLWSELCGTAFILSYWNPQGGRKIARIAPDPFQNENEEGEEMRETAPLYEGELAYGIVTPYEIYPESIYKQEVADQRSIIIEQVMSIEEIYDIYGIELEGENIDTYGVAPVEGGGGFGYATSAFALTYKTMQNCAYVHTYFERPSRRHPDGRLIVIAGGQLVHYGSLPYDEIPLVAVKCKEAAGQFFGRSVIQDLIPLQRAYNGCKNKIHDYIKTLAANPILVPEGTVADLDLLAEEGLAPGTVIEYSPERGVPELLRLASLPAEVRHECETLARDMEYVAGLSQLMMTGSSPTGVSSGTAIERLQSIDNTRLSLAGENLRTAVRRLAGVWLRIYKRHAAGYRVLNIAGSNEFSGAVVFCAEDINSFDIDFECENELVHGKEAQKAALLEAVRLGLFADEEGRLPDTFKKRAIEVLHIGGYAELLGESELHLQNARRENVLFEAGTPAEVGRYDDHALHIEEHRRFAFQLRSAVLRARSPHKAALLDAHIDAHRQALEREEASTARTARTARAARTDDNL